MSIVIIEYGMGNIGSVANMIRKIGVKPIISNDPEYIYKASKLILPGVGAFDKGMNHLHKLNLVDALEEKVLHQDTPILGICLGMQFFATYSEEGSLPGLNWIEAHVRRFPFSSDRETTENIHRIPHMGWNIVSPVCQSELFDLEAEEQRFYFAHSYHYECKNPEDVLSNTNYGFDFPSAIRRKNIFGVQFHPEKSHRFGRQLLTKFIEY